jgi:uncharacterized protein (TIGR02271 family)
MAKAELTQGMKVRSSDGANLGKIVRIEADHFLVEKGFFFPKDYAIPISLVSGVRDDEVWLTSSGAELQQAEGGTIAGAGYAEGARRDLTSEGEQRMQLSEEELEARKRVREAGEVTVRKDVVTEHRQMDVPVTREEVHVERTPASAASTPGGETFEEKTIRVPIREEEVEITKKPRVREEVRVSKTARQEERRVEGDVRREEARVEKSDESPTTGYKTGRDDEP